MTDPLTIAKRMAWRIRVLGQLLNAAHTLESRCDAMREGATIQALYRAIQALQEDQLADCREEGLRLQALYANLDTATVSGNPWSDGTTYLLITLASDDPSMRSREAELAALSAVSDEIARSLGLDGEDNT